MKNQIIYLIIIITLLFGVISAQNTTVDTKPSTTEAAPVTNQIPKPSPKVSNSEFKPKPSGSGPGLRGESGKRPDGPSNIPPANGGYSDKLAAITDEKILKVKNVLRFLPTIEQDLLAGSFLNILI
jgi:hypothetical protein